MNEFRNNRLEVKRELLPDVYKIIRELNTIIAPVASLELSNNEKAKVDVRRIEREVRHALDKFIKEKINVI